jgi:hypothetical protein
MTIRSQFCGLSLSAIIFLTSCMSSNLVAFQTSVVRSLLNSRGCATIDISRAMPNRAAWLCGWKHRTEDPSRSSRPTSRISPARYSMCASQPHPDDDPSSGSVLPVKDRIALYSQASVARCYFLVCVWFCCRFSKAPSNCKPQFRCVVFFSEVSVYISICIVDVL